MKILHNGLFTYIVEALKETKNKITHLTENYYLLVQKFHEFERELKAFRFQNKNYQGASAFKKSFWILLLLVGIPVLCLVDYASLKDFLAFLAFKVGEPLSNFINRFGFTIFFALELIVGGIVLWLRKDREEGNASKFKIYSSYVLIFAMIVVPMILIYTGYALDEYKTIGKYTKCLVLMTLSGVIHAAIFLCIDHVWHAITFLLFVIRKFFLMNRNPEKELRSIKPELRKLYNQFDDLILEYEDLEESEKKRVNTSLSNREIVLKEKLTNTIKDDDYDLEDDTNRFNNIKLIPSVN
jgi:hypothetical protein